MQDLCRRVTSLSLSGQMTRSRPKDSTLWNTLNTNGIVLENFFTFHPPSCKALKCNVIISRKSVAELFSACGWKIPPEITPLHGRDSLNYWRTVSFLRSWPSWRVSLTEPFCSRTIILLQPFQFVTFWIVSLYVFVWPSYYPDYWIAVIISKAYLV